MPRLTSLKTRPIHRPLFVLGRIQKEAYVLAYLKTGILQTSETTDGKPAELYGGNNHQTPCGKGQGEDWCWAACAVYFGTFAAHKAGSVKRKV